MARKHKASWEDVSLGHAVSMHKCEECHDQRRSPGFLSSGTTDTPPVVIKVDEKLGKEHYPIQPASSRWRAGFRFTLKLSGNSMVARFPAPL